MKRLERFAMERGATTVEYALLFALISLVVMGAASALGGSFHGVFQELSQNLPAGR